MDTARTAPFASQPGEARVWLVGIRGSRESRTDPPDGMGTTISRLADRIEEGLAASGVAVERIGLAYPASSIRYRRSCRMGADALRRLLITREWETRTVLLGLSQGAQVIREALDGDAWDRPGSLDQPPAVTAVVLLGDPSRDPSRDRAVLRGTASSARGIMAATRTAALPVSLIERTLSYCLEGDRVCAATAGRLGAIWSGTHTHYAHNAGDSLEIAAAFVLAACGTASGPRRTSATAPG